MDTVQSPQIGIVGAGLAGACAALSLAHRGYAVTLFDKQNRPVSRASLHNEGKLHFGYVYAGEAVPKTYQVVSEGSLQFLPLVTELMGVSPETFPTSDPFNYIVPDDSMRTVAEIADHFALVDSFVAGWRNERDLAPLKRSEPLSDERMHEHYGAGVQRAFSTPEIAVDSHTVANVVAAKVLAHPLISFRPRHLVTAAASASSQFQVSGQNDDGDFCQYFDAVINASWESRTALDAEVGVTNSDSWMWRWKSTISIDGPLEIRIPPTTALVGPYGDVVEYGRVRTYLSWYPACLQGLTNVGGLDPLAAEIAAVVDDDVREQSVEGLSRLVPAVARLSDLARRSTVGGGYIMALGTSDIDSATSGLHERHQVGPELHEGWCTLSTGKFCLAPLFGIEAANLIDGYLSATQ